MIEALFPDCAASWAFDGRLQGIYWSLRRIAIITTKYSGVVRTRSIPWRRAGTLSVQREEDPALSV